MLLLSYLLALPLALAVPVLETRGDTSAIPNKWIVTVEANMSSSDLHATVSNALELPGAQDSDAVWDFDGFKGFTITGPKSIVSLVAGLNAVELVELDTIVSTQRFVTQPDAEWGLARISHKEKSQDSYIYDKTGGKGTFAYCLDTGIYLEHNEFEGRAIFGKSFITDQEGDGNGHGTHTAGTIGGKTYGVAKNITLIAVKVLDDDGSGSYSQIISGIEYAVNNMQARKAAGKAVANMSLGGPRSSETVNRAVKAATDAGLFVAVAAGNDAKPASGYTPASAPSACTVGATDIDDNFASFSNYGPGLDINAPGVDVTSAWIGGPDDTNTISGTSMATPHIAGLGAYLLRLEGSRKPVGLCNRIKTLSQKGKISGLSGLNTANRLAYNGNGM